MRLMKPKATAQPTSTSTKSTSGSSSTTKTESLAKAESTSQTPMEIDDEAEFTKSDHVKGYKIVNGKKTSFFHNELSEEAAKLIGDIAPKKLEMQPAAEPTVQYDGGSVWNKAGTWEGTSAMPLDIYDANEENALIVSSYRERLYRMGQRESIFNAPGFDWRGVEGHESNDRFGRCQRSASSR